MSARVARRLTGSVKAAASIALLCLVTAAFLAVPADEAAMAWSSDPALNTLLCGAAGDQDCPAAVGDGSGGTIVAWQDYRSGAGWDIYAQRADPDGLLQWPDNGAPVCSAASDQVLPAAVSDGRGGAIIAWQDYRSGAGWDIYAQRVDATGAALWRDGGVAICTAPQDQLSPTAIADGAGGAVIIWQDRRAGPGIDIYAQRVGASGIVRWAPDGAAVCTAASDQTSMFAVSDTDGGAIIAWQDTRGGGYDIRAQRLDAAGTALWADNGVEVCAFPDNQICPVMVEDGSGGALVFWPDRRSQASYDVYGQRVDPAGALMWTIGGVPVCTEAGDQVALAAAGDGSGGAVVAWQDARSGAAGDIFAQRVGADGRGLWAAGGAPVCEDPQDQKTPVMVASGGSDGAVIVWQDRRSGLDYDLYGQGIDLGGSGRWKAGGVPVCTAAGDQESLSVAGDGSGGAVAAWQDTRQRDRDLYVQRVLETGLPSLPPDQPSNVSPADGEESTAVTPVLQCSAFSPGRPGDIHVASQWRITASRGDYGAPVYDSGTDNLALLQTGPGTLTLNGNTVYYWQVRHRSSNGLWSSWSGETSFATLDRPPDQPAGASPPNGASGIGLAPTLRSSAFSDPDGGDSHAASQWRVTATSGDYSRPAFQSSENSSTLTEVSLDGGHLTGNTTYHWQVRHQDSHGGWSPWSVEQSFTTQNQAPGQPGAVSPSAGGDGTDLSPVLETTAFSDTDQGDVHAASQWQISAVAGDYSQPVFDNARVAGSGLTSIVVSPGLEPGTTYYWRVRYQDSHAAWSEWSAESSFTTRAAPEDPGPREVNGVSWIYVGGVVLAMGLAGAVVLWRNASIGRREEQ